jgi:hypothetical protein
MNSNGHGYDALGLSGVSDVTDTPLESWADLKISKVIYNAYLGLLGG